MKKLFVFLFATIISLAAFADGKTCKVEGTTGTVEVNAYKDGTKIRVDFGNDTDVDVNINFEIFFSVKSNNYVESRTKRVPPHSSSSMEINTNAKEDEDLKNVRVQSLSGRKCK